MKFINNPFIEINNEQIQKEIKDESVEILLKELLKSKEEEKWKIKN